MHSIRFKITAITIAAILTTVLAVFLVCSPAVTSENDRKSVEMMNLIAQDTQKSLGKYFESIEQSVEMAAKIASDSLDSVILVEYGAAGRDSERAARTDEESAALDGYLAGYCDHVQEAFESVASRTHGVVAYYYCISPEISRSEHGFYYSKIGKTGFIEQEPLEAEKLDPADTEHNTWYYTPIRRGRPSWVGPYQDMFQNEEWICSYLVPIYKAGTLIGVLGMDIPVETLVEQVRPIRVYDTGYACLFDVEGRVIYHPKLEFGTIPNGPEISPLLVQLRGEASGSRPIRFSAGGDDMQMSFSTLSNGMKLVVIAPVREIDASWVHLVRLILLLTAAIIAVFAFILLFVMRLITRPLQRLTAASQRLAAADYDVELDYDSRDEVGVLTKSFKQMRDQLKLSIEDLNRRVLTDPLTGLPNMRYFFQLAQETRKRLLDEDRNPVLLYINLIGMKHFNRQYGFEAGDKLICKVAELLSRHFDERSLSHLSQDHFAVVTGEERLEETLGEIFRECEQADSGKILPLRVGVYRMGLDDVTVSVACDRAKYASDRHRGSYVSGYYYFDASMLKQAELSRYIISHLDMAISSHWITVHFQPLVRAVNLKVCDEEALARWFDPVMGMISPDVFVPILENARLIYKLDLYMLDQVLETMKARQREGIPLVPSSLNLSRADFDSCDIVEEICRRVDAAGIDRKFLTIEITESMIAQDLDFIKAQILRFQELGFSVWMDDFGSGYSSLDVLQDIHFDLIKFDMRFMQRFDEGDESKIILTELLRMTAGLGIETVCEGVETREQVDFLREIGCTKLQGYYFCKPLPYEEIQRRSREGAEFGFEDTRESGYFTDIGRVNLFDLGVVSNEDGQAFQAFFDSLPMGILEFRGDTVCFVRTNSSYRDYLKRFFGFDVEKMADGYSAALSGTGSSFIKSLRQCCETGSRVFCEEEMPDGSTVHSFLRRISVNPVDGRTAVAVAVLSITRPDEGTTYARIARALAADYYNIYYVDLDTEEFIEYSSTVGQEELAMERHGENFFAASREATMTRIYEEDRDYFLSIFTKENIVHELDEQGVFTATYRLTDSGKPMYVTMKITRMAPGVNQIIIGISLVDSQMKLKEQAEKSRQAAVTFGRIAALSVNYYALYSVDPETDRYFEYSANSDFESLGLAKEGEHFFESGRINGLKTVYPDDLPLYLRGFDKEKVLQGIREKGVYVMRYRLIIGGQPRPVSLRAALVKEPDGDKLIVGVSFTEQAPEQ